MENNTYHLIRVRLVKDEGRDEKGRGEVRTKKTRKWVSDEEPGKWTG
jgi:hypothetical protein